MDFHDWNGPSAVRAQLSALMDGDRLPHAVVLESKDAERARTAALLLAGALVCTAAQGERPCLVCPACRKVAAGSHPDVFEAAGGEAARSFHVEVIRAVRGDAYILPNEARCKVYILRNAQSMSEQAQNALLKVLEEPPASVVFLLTCDVRTHLLETIRSRATVFGLDEEEETRRPSENGKAEELAAQIAVAAVSVHEYELMQLTGKLEKDKELLRACLRELVWIMRDALILRAGGTCLLSGQADAARELSAALTEAQLAALLNAVRALVLALERNANQNLLLTRLCSTLRRAAGR